MNPLKNQSGFSLIEVVIVTVIVIILLALAVPRFQNFSKNAKRSVEFGVAGVISTGIQTMHVARVLGDAPDILFGYTSENYPQTLDNGLFGASSSKNPLFDNVLSTPITKGWHKVSFNKYQGPYSHTSNDSVWAYKNTTGIFEHTEGEGDDPSPETVIFQIISFIINLLKSLFGW